MTTDTGSYGERLDQHWHSKTIVTALSVGGPLSPDVTIARIAGGPGYGFVSPVPAQEGYALSLELMDYNKGELWLDGRSTPQTELLRNNSVFFDLRNSVRSTRCISTFLASISTISRSPAGARRWGICVSYQARASTTR